MLQTSKKKSGHDESWANADAHKWRGERKRDNRKIVLSGTTKLLFVAEEQFQLIPPPSYCVSLVPKLPSNVTQPLFEYCFAPRILFFYALKKMTQHTKLCKLSSLIWREMWAISSRLQWQCVCAARRITMRNGGWKFIEMLSCWSDMVHKHESVLISTLPSFINFLVGPFRSAGAEPGGMHRRVDPPRPLSPALIEAFDGVMQLSGAPSRGVTPTPRGPDALGRITDSRGGSEAGYRFNMCNRAVPSAALPIGEVLDIGEFSGKRTYLAAVHRAREQDLPETELPAVLQPCTGMAHAIAAADLSHTSGFAPFGPQGMGQETPWRDKRDCYFDPQVYYWLSQMGDTLRASVAQGFEKRMLWAEDCPEARHLRIHVKGSNAALPEPGPKTWAGDGSQAVWAGRLRPTQDSRYVVASIFPWRPW
uniref:Hygromycin phosphotransferase n=1 Tax=Burkholderia pseudomallei TaxID=28450 RepID=Q52501_BURPE|nr:hygromycin phosphotransferase [Burkholderia pseudomallei]prf//2107161A glpA gene [Burkholderia pseudomallei]